MPVIALKDVSVGFRGNQLLDRVSLELEEGRTYGLVGPNGSGKSVLLKLICGFLIPTSGEVYVDPKYMSAGRTYPDKFGIAINGPAYLPNRTAEGNLLELAQIRGQIGIAEIRAMLDAVTLGSGGKQKVKNFSLGMKQKLSLAQALMEEPDVLLLDEPFNALDSESVETVKELLREQKALGTTILFTSHNKQDIEDLCDDVFEIVGSKVVLLSRQQ